MDRETQVVVAAILTTLAETTDGKAPSGVMYAALMGKVDLHRYQTIIGALGTAGMIRLHADHEVELLPKGRVIADEINAAVAKRN